MSAGLAERTGLMPLLPASLPETSVSHLPEGSYNGQLQFLKFSIKKIELPARVYFVKPDAIQSLRTEHFVHSGQILLPNVNRTGGEVRLRVTHKVSGISYVV